MASLAHRIGCIIFPQKESSPPETSDIFSLPFPSINFPSLPAIISSSSALISFPSSSRLPLPDAATIRSRSVIQAASPVVCTSASTYSSAKEVSSPIGEYFFRMICPSLSVKISRGVPSLIRSVFRISFGITTLPRSSILRTIPVAFIFPNSSCTFYLFIAASGSYWFICMVIM